MSGGPPIKLESSRSIGPRVRYGCPTRRSLHRTARAHHPPTAASRSIACRASTVLPLAVGSRTCGATRRCRLDKRHCASVGTAGCGAAQPAQAGPDGLQHTDRKPGGSVPHCVSAKPSTQWQAQQRVGRGRAHTVPDSQLLGLLAFLLLALLLRLPLRFLLGHHLLAPSMTALACSRPPAPAPR